MIHIFDGAMGTMLQEGGLKAGGCPELMNIEQPEVVRKIHEAYIEAGATMIETNTFGASSLKLDHYGLEDRVAELNQAAVRIAQEASRGRAKIVGSLGPTGRFITPLGDLDFEEAYQSFYEQAKALADAGADYLIFETCIDIQEMRAGLLAAKDATKLPIICQLSYSEDGRSVTGTDPQTAAVTLEALGADIIGVNCSLGPQELVPIVQTLADNCSVPISVLPNAGMPRLENGKTVFPMQPDEFASWGTKLVAAGATYLGGCCGTTPAHIKALAAAVQDLSPAERKPADKRLRLTSRSKTIIIDKDLPTTLIGERINPTGRKKLAEEIKNGSLFSVKREAIDQVRAGARLLDVNMGVGGIDQAKAMHDAIREVAQITDSPLAIDTSDTKTLEAGLRAYPGRALINSVSAEKERIEEFLPLAKKYGAAILCLPITEDGVPKTAEDRVDVIRDIIKEAKKNGLTDGDFLLELWLSVNHGSFKHLFRPAEPPSDQQHLLCHVPCSRTRCTDHEPLRRKNAGSLDGERSALGQRPARHRLQPQRSESQDAEKSGDGKAHRRRCPRSDQAGGHRRCFREHRSLDGASHTRRTFLERDHGKSVDGSHERHRR